AFDACAAAPIGLPRTRPAPGIPVAPAPAPAPATPRPAAVRRPPPPADGWQLPASRRVLMGVGAAAVLGVAVVGGAAWGRHGGSPAALLHAAARPSPPSPTTTARSADWLEVV